MESVKQNHPISIDSETGLYWSGQQILRRRSLIREVMEKILPGSHALRRRPAHWMRTPHFVEDSPANSLAGME